MELEGGPLAMGENLTIGSKMPGMHEFDLVRLVLSPDTMT